MVQADLLVHGEGSIYLLRPTSRRGQRWIDEHVSEHRQEWAGAIVVEHRYIRNIVRGARRRPPGPVMSRWRPWPERRREIQQELAFAAAGIWDLANVADDDEDEADPPRCIECGEISPCQFERDA